MNSSEIITVIAAVGAIASAIGAFINSRRIHEVHVAINSRMDELLRVSGVAAHAEGVTEGRRDTIWARNKLMTNNAKANSDDEDD